VRERIPSLGNEPSIIERIESPDRYLARFFVRHLGQILPVNTDEIVRLEADDDYTAVYVNGKRVLMHVALREMENRLDPKTFVRVHRSSMVNLAHVLSATQNDRRVALVMSDGVRVTSSRSRSAVLNALLL
jgi:two-component system, LytTR family, response regulator